MVTTRASALRDAGERHACQMLFEGGRFRCRPPFLFLHTKRPARFAKSQLSCRSFVQLRQQESNLRWGSQSPLPYRLAMAHRARYYTIFFVFPQGEGSTFPLLRPSSAAFCAARFVKKRFFSFLQQNPTDLLRFCCTLCGKNKFE